MRSLFAIALFLLSGAVFAQTSVGPDCTMGWKQKQLYAADGTTFRIDSWLVGYGATSRGANGHPNDFSYDTDVSVLPTDPDIVIAPLGGNEYVITYDLCIDQGITSGTYYSSVSPNRVAAAEPYADWDTEVYFTLGSTIDSPLLAFVGAEGFGRDATGGRGGTVIKVTNLNDSGTGSLRACVEASGARTCIFEIGGTIALSSTLAVSNPNITIAGQTAPGGGIAVRDQTLILSGDNIILRYFRARLGNVVANVDAIEMYSDGSIVDHVSASWGDDETFSFVNAKDVTVQHTIISETMNDGSHAFLSLVNHGTERVSFYRMWYQNFIERGPKLFAATTAYGSLDGATGLYDIWNSLFYNWVTNSSACASLSECNFLNNYYKDGPLEDGGTYRSIRSMQEEAGLKIWVDGNLGPECSMTVCSTPFDICSDGCESIWRAPSVITVPYIRSIDTAENAKDSILAADGSGASQRLACDGSWVNNRDAVDARLATEFSAGTGGLITDPSDVGGYPTLSAGTPCTDTDGDGMPDTWEDLHAGPDSATADNNVDSDGDGYTNLEEYLNGTLPG